MLALIRSPNIYLEAVQINTLLVTFAKHLGAIFILLLDDVLTRSYFNARILNKTAYYTDTLTPSDTENEKLRDRTCHMELLTVTQCVWGGYMGDFS